MKFYQLTKTIFSLLALLGLLSVGLTPALAQHPGPGDETPAEGADQPPPGADETSGQPYYEGGPVTPARTSPWAHMPEGALGMQPPNIQVDPDKVYLATTWSDNAVHFLDASLNDTGSFPTGDTRPNALASDGYLIFTGHFDSQSVHIFDYDGNLLFTWTDSRLDGVQGMELVNGRLAFYESGTAQVHFFTYDGTYQYSIDSPVLSVEGLAYDGTLLWELGDELVGINPVSGAVVRTLTNPGFDCQYTGTGLTANAYNQLTVACMDGSWWVVSTVDGSVLATGNNGLDMYGLASSAVIRMDPVYIRSTVGPPWDQNNNEAIMDSVFGAGYWSDLRYEEVDPDYLFSGSYNLIFMEGSDDNADELEAFLTGNQSLLEEWVGYGGCLLLNSAPNEGDGMSFGFDGVTLAFSYTFGSDFAAAVDPLHPIFNEPFLPITDTYTGTDFAHSYVWGGDVSDVIIGENDYVSLAEKDWGMGHAMFGGMTTVNFHYPQPEATNLRANLLYYLTTFGCQVNYPIEAGDDGTLFFEDFEYGLDRWTVEGIWNLESQADNCGAMIAPFPSPNNAAYYGINETCTYSSTLYSGTLTLNTPIQIPLSDDTPYLTLHSYEQTEDVCADWDFRIVQVSNDGGVTWNTLDNLCTEGYWYTPSFELSAYAGDEILLRFLFDTIDSSYDIFFGWMLDDIAVGYPVYDYGINFVTKANVPYVLPSVFFNDYDPEWAELDVLSFDDSSLLGTLVYNDDGIFTYDPRQAFASLEAGEQALETFSYVVSDGLHTDTAKVYIIVQGLDDPPVAMEDFYTTRNDRTLNVGAPGVMANDYDPEGASLTAYLALDPSVGSLTFNANGSFNYIPPVDYVGDTSFFYWVTDGYYWSSNVSRLVSFAEPEIPLYTPVDGFTLSALFAEPIPPVTFNFEVNGSPSLSATFTDIGPGYTSFNAMPNIEGPTNGTLYIDLGTYVFDASFGFVESCYLTDTLLTDAITVTAYDASMNPLGTLFFDAGNTGYDYPENRAVINIGTSFQVLSIDFTDSCGAFVVDNLWYFTAVEPTTANIAITPSHFWTFVPVTAK